MHCQWKCKLEQPLWKTVWRFLKKLKTELLYYLAILLLGIYPREVKSLSRKDICTLMFIAALLTTANTLKYGYSKCKIDRGMDTETGTEIETETEIEIERDIHTHKYTHNETLFHQEKEGNTAIYDNMDGPPRHYTK